jgi:TrpR-related protein YerC/YecD
MKPLTPARDHVNATDPDTRAARLQALAKALLALKEVEEMTAFLRDLCTPAELEALGDRWQVVPALLAGLPYREIHDRLGVSVTTVGRVARCLDMGAGGYQAAARHLGLRRRPP